MEPQVASEAMIHPSLHVVHAAETIRGGIASYLREIVSKQVARYGAGRIAVIVPDDQLQDLGPIVGAVLIGVRHSRQRIQTAWRVRRALSRMLYETPAEIVHVHSSFAGVICRLPPLDHQRFEKLVYCPHGWAFVRAGRSALIAGPIERMLARQCDAIVCVSSSERDAALQKRLPAHKLHVIYNGLPDRSPMNAVSVYSESRPLRLVFMGRLDRQKGFDVLLGALDNVERDVEVDVFGESVLGEYKRTALPPSIHMHGWQGFSVIEPYLLSSDALVMPSRWEALGISALEAMRAGKPVIASAVGGLVEVIEEGVTGCLVPPGDATALARVLDGLQRNELADMGRRARLRFLERFRIEQCESKLASLYEAL